MRFSLRAKRMLTGAAAGALVLSMLPAGIASADAHEVCANAPVSDFTDRGTTHADNIDCLVAYDIAQGRTATLFGTFEDLTRAQAATLFVNFAVVATDGAIADDIDEDEDVPFVDIDGNTHEGNIEALYRLGLIEGTTATTYSPGDSITRAQFATILFNAHVALGVEFDDTYPAAFTDTVGNTHEEAINALAGEGIITGQTATTYNPSGNVLRGQTATLLMESAGLLDELGLWQADRLAPPAGATFTDAPELVSFSAEEDNDLIIGSFTFDEQIGVSTNAADFKLYAANDPNTPTPGVDYEISDNELTVNVEFDLDGDGFERVSLAAVAGGAVIDADGNDNPEGAIAVQDVTVDGSFTDAPDLQSVENFRVEPGVNPQNIRVDFVFDEEAVNLNATGYHLVDVNGVDEYQGTVISGDGETVHTVAFALTDVDSAADVARGYVETATVALEDGAPPVSPNPFQSAEVSGASATPDLVSVSFDETNNRVTYTFDEAVGPSPTAAQFTVYDATGDEYETTAQAVARSSTNNAVVIAEFTSIDGDSVGTSIGVGAVREATGAQRDNRPDEMRRPTADVSFDAGETTAPDLLSVELSVSATDLQGDATEYEGVFTFDAEADAVSATPGDFRLYAEDGTLIEGDATTLETDGTVTVTFDSANALDNIEDAVIATVVQGAAEDGGLGSPEGVVTVGWDS